MFLGKCPLELAQGPSRVALTLHNVRGSTPFCVTNLSPGQFSKAGRAPAEYYSIFDRFEAGLEPAISSLGVLKKEAPYPLGHASTD
jgi:hypothetical protein